MGQLVRRALLQLAPRARWEDRAKRAAAILKSFQLTVTPEGSLTAGLDVEAAAGFADSGQLDEDLTDLLVALGEAAQEQDSGVVFLIDEVHFLTTPELEALIAALHKTVQRQLPITMVGAGLPQLPRLAGEAKSSTTPRAIRTFYRSTETSFGTRRGPHPSPPRMSPTRARRSRQSSTAASSECEPSAPPSWSSATCELWRSWDRAPSRPRAWRAS